MDIKRPFIVLGCIFVLSCSPKINNYFSGIVVDEWGNPIDSVLVIENFITEDYLNQTFTDSNGYFWLKRRDNFIADLILSKKEYVTDTVQTVGTMHGEHIVYSPLLTQDSSVVVLHKAVHSPIANTYFGVSDKGYECIMKIKEDNSVLFVFKQPIYEYYAEYMGDIKQIGDSLFNINWEMTFGQFYMKTGTYNEPVFSVFIDNTSSAYDDLKKFDIIYSNGYTKSVEPIQEDDHMWVQLRVDESLFNKKEGSDYFIISTKRKNPITNEPLNFKVRYNCSADFTILEEVKKNFDVVINNNKLRLINNIIPQTGRFELHSNK